MEMPTRSLPMSPQPAQKPGAAKVIGLVVGGGLFGLFTGSVALALVVALVGGFIIFVAAIIGTVMGLQLPATHIWDWPSAHVDLIFMALRVTGVLGALLGAYFGYEAAHDRVGY